MPGKPSIARFFPLGPTQQTEISTQQTEIFDTANRNFRHSKPKFCAGYSAFWLPPVLFPLCLISKTRLSRLDTVGMFLGSFGSGSCIPG